MKRKKLVQWNFGDFSTSFGEFFYIKNAYPPPYLPPDPPPALQTDPTHHPPPVAGKILRPPAFFNLSTYALEALNLGTLSVFPALFKCFMCVSIQCFQKAPMHMTHEAAMEYCETKPGHFPLLLKTKEEIMEMASKFPGTGDIW